MNLKPIRTAKTKEELNKALKSFVTDRLKPGGKIRIEDISTKPNRKEAIIECIKYYMDNGTFSKLGFTLLFKDKEFSEFKKISFLPLSKKAKH